MHSPTHPPAHPPTADNWDLSDSTVTDNRPDCELNVLAKEGSFFGFPRCHTGPSGGNVDTRPYLRPVGVGPQLVDPDVNLDESVMKCNGPNLQFVPAIQAMGPHTAPLGMVRSWGAMHGRGSVCWKPRPGQLPVPPHLLPGPLCIPATS